MLWLLLVLGGFLMQKSGMTTFSFVTRNEAQAWQKLSMDHLNRLGSQRTQSQASFLCSILRLDSIFGGLRMQIYIHPTARGRTYGVGTDDHRT